MTYSLNEVEAMAKRATRGAGYAWGLAEEAGKATRWLCAHNIDGVTVLADVLQMGFAETADVHRIDDTGGQWQADDVLCPIMTGATLSDHGRFLDQGPVSIQNIAAPLFLLPFAANAARQLGSALEISCDGVSANVDADCLSCPSDFPQHGASVSVSKCSGSPKPNDLVMRSTPNAAAKEVLDTFANRTYAPATEESRMLGAGAGLSDND